MCYRVDIPPSAIVQLLFLSIWQITMILIFCFAWFWVFFFFGGGFVYLLVCEVFLREDIENGEILRAKFLEQFWGLHLKTWIEEDQEKLIQRSKVWETFHLKINLKLSWMNCHGKEKQKSRKMRRKVSLIELAIFSHNLASLVRNILPQNSLSGAVYFFFYSTRHNKIQSSLLINFWHSNRKSKHAV